MTKAVRRAATSVSVLCSCASLVLAIGVPVAAAAAPDTPSAHVAGLGQVWETSQGTWAVVAMGHLENRLNTFWQMLFRPAASASWSLVTPPGVASNGGFSAGGADGTSGAVVSGFQPSRYLQYSPLATTTDHGKHWSAGTLDAALVFAADAVAVGAGDDVLALVRRDGASLVRSGGSLTRWSTVATAASLGSTAAGRVCRVEALTAVVVAAGEPEVGAECGRSGAVGLFRKTARGTWVSSGPRIPGPPREKSEVVRLWSGATGTTVLIERSGAGGPSLVVAWRTSPGDGWTVSAPVALSGDVLSTTLTAGSGVAVVTSTGWRARTVESIARPGRAWRVAGRLPAGTQGVAVTGAGLVALVVHDSRLTIWQRDERGRWHETSQRFRVPIEYGSST